MPSVTEMATRRRDYNTEETCVDSQNSFQPYAGSREIYRRLINSFNTLTTIVNDRSADSDARWQRAIQQYNAAKADWQNVGSGSKVAHDKAIKQKTRAKSVPPPKSRWQ